MPDFSLPLHVLGTNFLDVEQKIAQESGGMEGALVVLLLACIIIKSGLLAFCLYAARFRGTVLGIFFWKKFRLREKKTSRKIQLTNFSLKIRVGEEDDSFPFEGSN